MHTFNAFCKQGWVKTLMIAGAVAVSAFGIAQNVAPSDPSKDIALVQRMGNTIPLDTEFKDENGNKVKIGDYYGKRPVIIMPIFYKCQGSCLLIQQGAIKVMRGMKERVPGRDYDVIAISIDPRETCELAKGKKAEWLRDFVYEKESQDSVHFLTGSLENIKKVTDSIGFTFRFDPVADIIRHPSTLVVSTPEGRVSAYLTGVYYSQRYLMTDLDRAAKGEVGPPDPKPVLWGCLKQNPYTGQYTLQVERTLKVAGVGTAIILFCSIFVMSLKHRRQPLHRDTTSEEGGVPKTEG